MYTLYKLYRHTSLSVWILRATESYKLEVGLTLAWGELKDFEFTLHLLRVTIYYYLSIEREGSYIQCMSVYTPSPYFISWLLGPLLPGDGKTWSLGQSQKRCHYAWGRPGFIKESRQGLVYKIKWRSVLWAFVCFTSNVLNIQKESPWSHE